MGLPPLPKINDLDERMNLENAIDFIRELDLSGDRYAVCEVGRRISAEQAETIKELFVQALGEEMAKRIIILSPELHVWSLTEGELEKYTAVRQLRFD